MPGGIFNEWYQMPQATKSMTSGYPVYGKKGQHGVPPGTPSGSGNSRRPGLNTQVGQQGSPSGTGERSPTESDPLDEMWADYSRIRREIETNEAPDTWENIGNSAMALGGVVGAIGSAKYENRGMGAAATAAGSDIVGRQQALREKTRERSDETAQKMALFKKYGGGEAGALLTAGLSPEEYMAYKARLKAMGAAAAMGAASKMQYIKVRDKNTGEEQVIAVPKQISAGQTITPTPVYGTPQKPGMWDEIGYSLGVKQRPRPGPVETEVIQDEGGFWR